MSLLDDIGSLKWGDWIRGLLAAAISAAASALAANPLAAVLGAQQFTTRQLVIMAGSAALVAVGNFLKQSPIPDKRVAVALLPGVHTEGDVEKVMKATAPGQVPTAEVAAAILAKPTDQRGGK